MGGKSFLRFAPQIRPYMKPSKAVLAHLFYPPPHQHQSHSPRIGEILRELPKSNRWKSDSPTGEVETKADARTDITSVDTPTKVQAERNPRMALSRPKWCKSGARHHLQVVQTHVHHINLCANRKGTSCICAASPHCFDMVGPVGFEPTTLGLKVLKPSGHGDYARLWC